MDGSPFHPGEIAAQERARVRSHGGAIRPMMPDQHRFFFWQLPLALLAVPDDRGHPIATLVHGQPGFIRSPSPTTLAVRALPASDDPATPHLRPGSEVGLLGLEFQTRRRNRANGLVTGRDDGGFSVAVTQSFGNCPKYIQARIPRPHARDVEPIETPTGLDAAARAQIASADTFFVASRSSDRDNGGLDMSHRGGRPGFVGIKGETLLVPDFAGNNYFNSLGNLIEDPRCGLLFLDFEQGTLLQLQGRAEIVWEGEEVSRFAGAQRLVRIVVEKAWRRRNALPLAWSPPEPAATTLRTGVWDASADRRALTFGPPEASV
jgi:hypothetical protein